MAPCPDGAKISGASRHVWGANCYLVAQTPWNSNGCTLRSWRYAAGHAPSRDAARSPHLHRSAVAEPGWHPLGRRRIHASQAPAADPQQVSRAGPSWLTLLGHSKDSLWSVDFFRCEFIPQSLSSDHDPLFRFHRWRANLRILQIREIKTVVLRNYSITPTRAPADIRDASQPAPIRRAPRGARRSDGGLVVSRTGRRGRPTRQVTEGRFAPERSRHSSARAPRRGQFVPDLIFAEHRGQVFAGPTEPPRPTEPIPNRNSEIPTELVGARSGSTACAHRDRTFSEPRRMDDSSCQFQCGSKPYTCG